MKPSKKITLIRQEIRESNDSKEQSKDKTAIWKQYPSLNKSAPDIRKTLTASSHIQGIAIISDLFDNEDSITDMEMDTDDDDFSEHICHVNMVSVHGGLWGDDDMIDIQITYRFTNKCVHKMEKTMPSQMEVLIHVSWEVVLMWLIEQRDMIRKQLNWHKCQLF